MAVRLAPVSGRSTLLPLCYGGLASPSVALLSPGSPSPGSAGHRSLAKKNKIGPLKFVNDQNNFEASIPRVHQLNSHGRRELFGWFLGLSYLFIDKLDANAAGLPPEEKPSLCDDACGKELENVPIVTTESGLQYRDIKVGRGPSPPVGFQVIANYVAMVPSGQVFDSSLEKAEPYLFRVGAGQVVKGLDEGILGMKVGGKRRLYIPGPLAFPKGLTSAPGRPRVPPSSPVIFDVSLEYIPGLDFEDE